MSEVYSIVPGEADHEPAFYVVDERGVSIGHAYSEDVAAMFAHSPGVIALGWRLWSAMSAAEDFLGVAASVPGLADAMNAWKANVPALSMTAPLSENTDRESK